MFGKYFIAFTVILFAVLALAEEAEISDIEVPVENIPKKTKRGIYGGYGLGYGGYGYGYGYGLRGLGYGYYGGYPYYGGYGGYGYYGYPRYYGGFGGYYPFYGYGW